jgi:tetratricopeptide (TPR) repeat protein
MPGYEKICFVIMPFGKKPVNGKMVDFDSIYAQVFEPAIKAVNLPEGGSLASRRTDKEFFSGSIDLEMFHYLEYSRFALADTSGLNANVFYELGARHRARASGTAIFHQADTPIPFDIKQIKAFPYEYEPDTRAQESRDLITKVLTESLRENRLDSPIRIALAAQQHLHAGQQTSVEKKLQDAENFLRVADWNAAITAYQQAIKLYPTNPLIRMRLGLLLRDRDRWAEALEHFNAAISAADTYGEAWRERGIAENKLAKKEELQNNPAPGETSLRRAIELNPDDFDALASLGGVLKRAQRFSDSLSAYRNSTACSDGHPYPLLNSIKLSAYLNKSLSLSFSDRKNMSRAEQALRIQIVQNPPYNAPWSFFDLAEICLLSSRPDEFIDLVKKGLDCCTADWQAKTFMESLIFLAPAESLLPRLQDGLKTVREYISD